MNKKEIESAPWYPFIKANRKRHDSGYRCFDVGYIQIGYTDTKIENEIILGSYTDHIWLTEFEKLKSVHMDIMDDGKIRFHSNHGVKWNSQFALSSMQLEEGDISTEKLLKYYDNNK